MGRVPSNSANDGSVSRLPEREARTGSSPVSLSLSPIDDRRRSTRFLLRRIRNFQSKEGYALAMSATAAHSNRLVRLIRFEPLDDDRQTEDSGLEGDFEQFLELHEKTARRSESL